MKKIIFAVFSLFAFAFICSAKESWEFIKLNIPASYEIETINFGGKAKNSDEYEIIIAIGKEYNCENQEEKICNIYIIDEDGKTVKKYNKYYNIVDAPFPGYTHYSLNQTGINEDKFNLEVVTNEKALLPYKGASEPSIDGVVIKDSSKNPIVFNYINCAPSTFVVKRDMCVVGVEGKGYGILASDGEFIIQPNTKYNKVYEDSNNQATLEDSEKNSYLVVNDNGDIEELKKTFLTSNSINIQDVSLLGISHSKNVYEAGGKYFTIDGVSSFHEPEVSTPENIYHLVFIDKNPYFLTGMERTGFTPYSLIDWNNNTVYSDVYCPSALADLFSYNKSGKFNVTNVNKDAIAQYSLDEAECIMALGYSGSKNAYLFIDSYSGSILPPNGWTQDYYLLKKVYQEDPKPTPDPKTDPSSSTPKYSCQKAEGYFWDKNGNKVTKEEYEKLCPEKVPDTGFVIPVVIISILASSGFVLKNRKKVLNNI